VSRRGRSDERRQVDASRRPAFARAPGGHPLSLRQTRAAHAGLAAEPQRARLDEFFHRRRAGRFGAFVAFYLAALGWSQSSVGLALSTGGLAGVLGQIPGGALADAVRWKRALVAAGILTICGAALILALIPTFPLVFAAEVLHGLTAGLVTPALAAISLGLVGRRAMSARTGRNFRFAAFGTALTAAVLGLVGTSSRRARSSLRRPPCARRR
jgi:hypothetical protein